MKKLLVLLLATLTIAGCSSKSDDTVTTPTPTPVVTATPDMGGDVVVEIDAEIADMLTVILEGVEYGSMPTAITDENIANTLFIEPVEGLVGASADAMISAQAHSVVLVRVGEDSDVNEIAKQIEENAKPNKWICVEAEKVAVEVKGNYILLVMSDADTTDLIVANFLAAE